MIYTFDYNNAYSSGPALPIVEFDLKAIGSETAVRVLGDKQGGEAILGRDVLNQTKVILNGPAQVVEIPVE